MPAPLVVLPDPAVMAVTARRLRETGHTVQDGFTLPAEPFDLDGHHLLCAGVVDGAESASAALVAAVRGTGLLLSVSLPEEESVTFLQDLGRVGTVRMEAPAARVGPAVSLAADQRQLLELLAAGATIPEAARLLYISVRTAERRLGVARRSLGVRTTAEALGALGAD